jgi:peptidoglycan/xylan/chitin deacetylase (PgdA/CDA1 family)
MITVDKKRLVASSMSYTHLFDAYSFFRQLIINSVAAIIEYHRICPMENLIGDPTLVLTPEVLEKQMRYFSTNFQILSMDELFEFIRLKKRPPRRAAVITIDDGYRDIFVHAYPILERYKIPATIFLVSGYVDSNKPYWWDRVSHAIYQSTSPQLNVEGIGKYWIRDLSEKSVANKIVITAIRESPEDRRNGLIAKVLDECKINFDDFGGRLQLSWNEIKEMHKNGLKFGSHSVSHPRLTDISLERATAEIVESKQAIEENLDEEVTTISYPYGDYDAKILDIVREAGFKGGVTAFTPYRTIGFEDNVLCLPRIPAVKDLNEMKGMLCGLVGDIQTYVTKGPI